MILPIRTLGDPVLREPAKPVTSFDRSLRRLVEDMLETMYDAPGVGLAGPQVGVSLRVFTFDDGESGPKVVVNPEGCLSIPGPFHPTPRFARVRCRGQDIRGRVLELDGEGLLARIFQHETDHLDGMLYIDRLDEEGRRAVMGELRRIELGLSQPEPRRRGRPDV
jgi:peptide deformylase